jgi:integrase
MLTIFRRHIKSCKFANRGRSHRHCNCPIAVEGKLRGEMIRKALDVRSWEAAQKQVRSWEIHGIKAMVSIGEAYDRFIEQHRANGSADETIKKHVRLKKLMVEYFGDPGIRTLSVDDVSKFRESWRFAPLTTRNTIERLRGFFKFCIEREWLEKNPAATLKLPKITQVDRKPYDGHELMAIECGLGDYPNWGIYKTNTRERVRTFVAVLRWTGMRIGDAVQLSRSKIVDGQITLRTEKTGKRVSIPMHPDIAEGLKNIGGEYFFWSGNGKVSSAVSDWERTLTRLGKLSHVKCHAHRWRHTFIIECLWRGIPVSEVAAIVGNSPRIIEQHYSQWCQQRANVLNAAVKSMWELPS